MGVVAMTKKGHHSFQQKI